MRDIGFAKENIELLVATLREKCVALQQAGVLPLNSLYTGPWCTLDGGAILSTRRGGRQGCLHGSASFNMEYVMALSQVRQELVSLNMCSGVRLHDNCPFWVARSAKFLPCAEKSKIQFGSPTAEVTFADDQACLVTSTTPRGLQRVVTITLETAI